MNTGRKSRKRRRDRIRRQKTTNVSLGFTRLTAESDKATTDFVNFHRLTTNRTSRIDKREEFRFFGRRRTEGLVTRLTEVLLGATLRMSIFVEVRGTAVWTFDH